MELLIHVKKDGSAEIMMDGSGADIMAALGLAINHIYSDLTRVDAKSAMGFRLAMWSVVSPSSPVWTPSSNSEGVTMIVPQKNGRGAA